MPEAYLTRGEYEKLRDVTGEVAGRNRWKRKQLTNVTERVLKDGQISQTVMWELREKLHTALKGSIRDFLMRTTLQGQHWLGNGISNTTQGSSYPGSIGKFEYGLSKTGSNAWKKQGWLRGDKGKGWENPCASGKNKHGKTHRRRRKGTAHR